MQVYRFTNKSAHMVSFGGCGQTILLYKSAGGTKTTETLLRINILNKMRTCWYPKFMQTKICCYYIAILLSIVMIVLNIDSGIKKYG